MSTHFSHWLHCYYNMPRLFINTSWLYKLLASSIGVLLPAEATLGIRYGDRIRKQKSFYKARLFMPWSENQTRRFTLFLSNGIWGNCHGVSLISSIWSCFLEMWLSYNNWISQIVSRRLLWFGAGGPLFFGSTCGI